MEHKDYKYALLTAFIILGIVISMQFRSTIYTKKQKTPTDIEIEQLNTMLNEEKMIGNTLKAAVNENEKLWNDSLKTVVNSSDNTYLKKLVEELEDARIKAGFTDVKGPGIVIKLDDAPATKNMDSYFLIIHDSDIKILLRELIRAGAQAISINEERIIATSEPVCAGPTIQINKNRYPVPYTVKVIGNPDVLYKRIYECDRVSYMRRDGIRVSIDKSKEIEIAKYANNDIDRLITGMEVMGK